MGYVLKDTLALWKYAKVIAVRVIGTAAGLGMNLALTRALGATQAGYIFLGITTITILTAMTQFGLETAVVRFSGVAASQGDWGRFHGLFQKSLKWALFGAALGAVVLWWLAPLFAKVLFRKPEMELVLKILAIGIPLLSVAKLTAMQLQGAGASEKTVYLTTIGTPMVAMVLFFCLGPLGHDLAAMLYTGALGLTCGTGLLWYARLWYSKQTQASDFSTQILVKSCLPLWGTAVMMQVLGLGGQFISGVFLSSDQVALLAISQKIANLMSISLVAMNLVVSPKIAAFWVSNDRRAVERITTQVICLMIILGVPLLGFLLIFAEWFLSFFGDEFRQGALFLRIIAVGQFINIITGPAGFLLTMTGHEKAYQKIVTISCVFTLCLLFVLTICFSTTGTAIAISIGVACQNVMAITAASSLLKIKPYSLWQVSWRFR